MANIGAIGSKSIKVADSASGNAGIQHNALRAGVFLAILKEALLASQVRPIPQQTLPPLLAHPWAGALPDRSEPAQNIAYSWVINPAVSSQSLKDTGGQTNRRSRKDSRKKRSKRNDSSNAERGTRNAE